VRHVEIVYKNDDFIFPVFGAEPALPPFGGHFGLDLFLDLIAGGLPGKGGD